MWRTGVIIVLLSFLAGCSTVRVKTTYDQQTDFSKIKTYAWLQETDTPSEDVRINSELVRRSVRDGVEEALRSKGLEKVARGQADFLITWFGDIKEKIKMESIDHFYTPYGYGALHRDPTLNDAPAPNSLGSYEEGSIIIDFLNPASHTLLWRGVGQKRVEEGQSEVKIKKNIIRAVKTILGPFPPR